MRGAWPGRTVQPPPAEGTAAGCPVVCSGPHPPGRLCPSLPPGARRHLSFPFSHPGFPGAWCFRPWQAVPVIVEGFFVWSLGPLNGSGVRHIPARGPLSVNESSWCRISAQRDAPPGSKPCHTTPTSHSHGAPSGHLLWEPLGLRARGSGGASVSNRGTH